MHRWCLAAACAVASRAPCRRRRRSSGRQDRLNAYTVVTTADQLAEFEAKGLDVAESEVAARGSTRADDPDQRVRRRTSAPRARARSSRASRAARPSSSSRPRRRPTASPSGGRTTSRAATATRCTSSRASTRGVTKLVKIGTTLKGREILALKVTQGARGQRDGSRPAVLFSATQHAREWIATEIDRRLMYHYVEGWASNDQAIKKLLKATELWFVPVMNPDGYQYTFDIERLWRKNLRDNDGDGQTTIADGVDPNRNYPEHFKYDEEGSSKIHSSQTYRGPGPASERETQAIMGLSERVGFEFNVNYHSNGRWLLYPEGWQISSPTADDPIYFALSGNLDRPAIEGFHPGLSSDVLYVTNGEANDFMHKRGGALAWTPELSPGCPTCGFVFPDDPALVQEEFERNLPFAESVANSAADPDDPKSSLGIKTKPFYIKSDDPYKDGHAGRELHVQVLLRRPAAGAGAGQAGARRGDGQVQDQRRRDAERLDVGVEGRREVQARLGLLPRHARHGHRDQARRQGGGLVRGRRPEERRRSPTRWSPTPTARCSWWRPRTTRAPRPRRPRARTTCSYYLDALAANGVAADVYDVDARGRTAPDPLGVLSHYKGVIWYTGDDIVTRTAGRGRRQRRPARARRDARDARLHGRGRPRGLHGQARRHAVHGRRRRHPVLRPEGRGRLRRRANPALRPAALPAAARLARSAAT